MTFDLNIRKALDNGRHRFTLDVQIRSDSERIVIVGPSGSGKSLLLKMIAGLLRPDAGHILVREHRLFDAQAGIHLPPRQRNMAYVFQDYALFPHLTVRQNIGFASTRHWWKNPGRQQRFPEVDHWLDTFQLTPVADQYPAELSGGQRQRTALARALVTQPRALLLDEPFSALDHDLRTGMRNELLALQQRLRVPMILITHDNTDAEHLGQHIISLREGRVV
ncbi:MAG: ATP-binding cassette domain-containing protein [Lautropia sp.]|nr:ATP-binding cassette domain-containing protein [Lautropia sp.]